MAHFNEEQLKELEQVFGLTRAEETLPIRDGWVKKTDKVWWRCSTGPEMVEASEHWDNIKSYPRLYQFPKPIVDGVKYVDL